MTNDDEILRLAKRVRALQKENADLKKENEDCKKKLNRARGEPGVDFVLGLVGGERTGYKVGHDIETKTGARLEVKLSHVNTSGSAKTKRWVWDNLRGLNGTKTYDWLVLLDEKEPRYEGQYPAGLPYVCFLVPRGEVDNIGNSVALNANLKTARGKQSGALRKHLVRSRNQLTDLVAGVAAP